MTAQSPVSDRPASSRQGLAVAALAFGVAAAVLALLGSLWALMNPGMGMLVVGLWTVLLVGAVGAIGLILSIAALVKRQRRTFAITGLVLSVLALAAAFIPYGQYLLLL